MIRYNNFASRFMFMNSDNRPDSQKLNYRNSHCLQLMVKFFLFFGFFSFFFFKKHFMKAKKSINLKGQLYFGKNEGWPKVRIAIQPNHRRLALILFWLARSVNHDHCLLIFTYKLKYIYLILKSVIIKDIKINLV